MSSGYKDEYINNVMNLHEFKEKSSRNKKGMEIDGECYVTDTAVVGDVIDVEGVMKFVIDESETDVILIDIVDISFAEALDVLKLSHRVRRKGWNGKGMFLQLIARHDYSIRVPIIDGELVPLSPWIGMKTADGMFVPWLASQTDILAEDWEIVL